MNVNDVKAAFEKISTEITKNKDYLIELDQRNGDGDLGISMSTGFAATYDFLCKNEEQDLGKVFMKMSSAFNENAPSSLGTIISICFMGMAKSLKGKTDASLTDFQDAITLGAESICERAGSKVGEKTILDALFPAIAALKQGNDFCDAFEKASKAAKEGSENTATMKAVHGRAAYYGEKSLGLIDGGSVVAQIIFEAIFEYVKTK